MFNFHSHENVIVKSWNVAIPNVEIANDVLLFLDHIRFNLKHFAMGKYGIVGHF